MASPTLSGIWRGPGPWQLLSLNIARDLKPSDIQPWAQAIYQERVHDMGKDSPRANCMPDPFAYYHVVDLARFVSKPPGLDRGDVSRIQRISVHRTIFTDGRELP